MSETHHEARVAEANDYHSRRKAKKEAQSVKVEERYEVRNGKVVKIVVAPSGNKFQTYVGKVKDCEEIIKKHNLRV